MAERGNARLLVAALEELLAELPSRARGSKEKFSEQAMGALRALVSELDFVPRDDLDEVELRVAQLEHRLKLLERPRDLPPSRR